MDLATETDVESTVFAATIGSHEPQPTEHAVRTLFGMLQTPLLTLLKKGNRVLVKLNTSQ